MPSLTPFIISFLITSTLFSLPSAAKEYEVKMLNFSDESGNMVFEPDFLAIELGDTVKFVPTDVNHSTRSYISPKEATSWKSQVNETVVITPDKAGAYLYYCPPHLAMGMIGAIVVGKVNKDVIESESFLRKINRFKSKLALQPQRLDRLLNKIEKHATTATQ